MCMYIYVCVCMSKIQIIRLANIGLLCDEVSDAAAVFVSLSQ